MAHHKQMDIKALRQKAEELRNKIGEAMNGEPRSAVYHALATLFMEFTQEEFGDEAAREFYDLIATFPSKLVKRAEDVKFWNLMFEDYDPPVHISRSDLKSSAGRMAE